MQKIHDNLKEFLQKASQSLQKSIQSYEERNPTASHGEVSILASTANHGLSASFVLENTNWKSFGSEYILQLSNSPVSQIDGGIQIDLSTQQIRPKSYVISVRQENKFDSLLTFHARW